MANCCIWMQRISWATTTLTITATTITIVMGVWWFPPVVVQQWCLHRLLPTIQWMEWTLHIIVITPILIKTYLQCHQTATTRSEAMDFSPAHHHQVRWTVFGVFLWATILGPCPIQNPSEIQHAFAPRPKMNSHCWTLAIVAWIKCTRRHRVQNR